MQKPSSNWLLTNARRPGLWLLVALFLLVAFLQSTELFQHHTLLEKLGIRRYTIERILYLIPVIWAAFLFGWRGGMITSMAALAFMLPAALLASPDREDALIETAGVFATCILMSYSLESLRRERKRAAELESAQKELHFFLEQVTRAQEEERRRIAWELHDDTIQSLIALCQQIDSLANSAKGMPRGIRSRLEGLYKQANTIMQEVRRLSQDLRPAALDNLGLVAALEWLGTDVGKYSRIDTSVKIVGAERRFSAEVELVLFRIAQEALRNVWKHANAKSAQIILEFEESKTKLTVSDDGRGFIALPEINSLPKSGKLGLSGMQERAHLLGGTLSIKSEPGKGTSIVVELPL